MIEPFDFIPRRLTETYWLAAQWSDDPSTQNGAILCGKKGLMLSTGVNTLPRGVKVTADRTIAPIKYSYMEHAERNAIYAAARAGKSVENTTLYAAWAACTDCARAIIQSGVKVVIRHQSPFAPEVTEEWAESIRIADEMMSEAGVILSSYKHPLPKAPNVLRHGKVWSPSRSE